MKNRCNKEGRVNTSLLQVLSKQRISKVGIVITYTLIWIIAFISYYFSFSPPDAMLYSLLFFYIVIPMTTLVLSYKIGVNGCWGSYQWWCALVFGLLYMLLEYLTYSISNMVAHSKWNMPNLEMLIYGGLLSVFGLCMGRIVGFIRTQRSI